MSEVQASAGQRSMIPHKITEIPFQKVAMDIMTYQGHDRARKSRVNLA